MKNKLEELRKKKQLTQEQLSDLSKVSRQTISAIENNQLNNIESKTMFRLATALGCDIGDIFFKENVVFTQHK